MKNVTGMVALQCVPHSSARLCGGRTGRGDHQEESKNALGHIRLIREISAGPVTLAFDSSLLDWLP